MGFEAKEGIDDNLWNLKDRILMRIEKKYLHSFCKYYTLPNNVESISKVEIFSRGQRHDGIISILF